MDEYNNKQGQSSNKYQDKDGKYIFLLPYFQKKLIAQQIKVREL